jgi:hypothetical protein
MIKLVTSQKLLIGKLMLPFTEEGTEAYSLSASAFDSTNGIQGQR